MIASSVSGTGEPGAGGGSIAGVVWPERSCAPSTATERFNVIGAFQNMYAPMETPVASTVKCGIVKVPPTGTGGAGNGVGVVSPGWRSKKPPFGTHANPGGVRIDSKMALSESAIFDTVGTVVGAGKPIGTVRPSEARTLTIFAESAM